MIQLSIDELNLIIPDKRDRAILAGIYNGTIKCVKDIPIDEPDADVVYQPDIISRLFDLSLFIRVQKGLLTLTAGGSVLGKMYSST